MAKSFCRYHHRQPATWNCPGCGLLLCQSCYPATPNLKQPHHCALCQTKLAFLGSANSAKPFWMKMPSFFLYPLQLNSLIFIAAISGLSLIVPLNLLGVLIGLLLFAMVVRYSLKVIELQSEGTTTAPTFQDVIGGQGSLVLKMLGVYFVLGVVIGFFGQLGMIAAIIGMLLMYVVLPASTMTLAVSGSFIQAINPATLLSLMFAMGWTYPAMVLVTGIVSSGPTVVFNAMLTPDANGQISFNTGIQFALVASFIYFTLVSYTIMGYTIFQHQGDLGFATLGEDEELDEMNQKQISLAEVDILMREGRFDDARNYLQVAASDQPADVDIQERYHRYLVSTKDMAKLDKQTVRLLDLLADQQNLHKAADVYLATVAVNKAFRLSSPNYRHRIAEELVRRRQFKAAIALLLNMHKDSPRYEELPAAYFVAAKAYSEGLNDDGRALQILDFLGKKFPQHPLMGDIQSYQQALLRLKAV